MKEENYMDSLKTLLMDGMTRIQELVNNSFMNEYSSVEIGIGCGVALLSCLLLYCCLCRARGKGKTKKVRVFGRIKEVTIHPGGGAKKRVVWIDPFRLTNGDFQRRFEDELTQFLYFLGSDCISPDKRAHIVFFDKDGKRNDKKEYQLDYQWLLRHYAANSREYAHTLIKSSCKHQELIEARDPGWSASEVLYELRSSGVGQIHTSTDLLVSWACQVNEICHGLRDKLNKRMSRGNHLDEALEGEASARIRDSVTSAMSDGMILAELMKEAITPFPKALRDHYNNLCSLQKVYCEEFIPFIDISRSNKRRLGKTEDPGETRDMMQETLEEIVGEGGNDMMEIMATSVLPRFNRYIEA